MSADPIRFYTEIRFILRTNTGKLCVLSDSFVGHRLCFFWSQVRGAEAQTPLPSSAKIKVRGNVPPNPPYVLECTSQFGTEKTVPALFRAIICVLL